jgi:hypothetical protein
MKPKKIEVLPDGNLKITVEYVMCRRGRQKQIVIPGEDGLESDTMRETMLMALARGRAWQRLIDEGVVASAKALAHQLGRDQSYVANIIGLCQLSPKIVHAIISGDYPQGLTLKNLRNSLPDIWDDQEKLLLGEN